MTLEIKNDGSCSLCEKVPQIYVSNSDFMKIMRDRILRIKFLEESGGEEDVILVGNLGVHNGEYFDRDPINVALTAVRQERKTYGFFAGGL